MSSAKGRLFSLGLNELKGDSIIRRTFSTWRVEKQNILESLKLLYKYFIRVLRVQKK